MPTIGSRLRCGAAALVRACKYANIFDAACLCLVFQWAVQSELGVYVCVGGGRVESDV